MDALKSTLPPSREGWALDLPERVVHERHALHARGLPRTRTEAEVRSWLPDGFTPCVECWPPAPATKPRVRTQAKPSARGATPPRRVVGVDIRQRERRDAQHAAAKAGGGTVSIEQLAELHKGEQIVPPSEVPET